MQASGSARSRRALLILLAGLGLVGVALAGVAWATLATPTKAAQPAPLAARPRNPGNTNLVISQVYGGGGNSGALYTNDFIEIFNPTNAPVTFTNWSVQYASAAGSTWQVSVLTGTNTLQPGQYFLIQEGRGAGGTQPLPTPDNLGGINMSATAGKVALVSNSTALTCSAPNCHADPSVVDFIGFGTTANDYEGANPAPAPSNTTSDVRNGGGCIDTDNNNLDFSIANPPTPRNTSSPFNPCATPASPTNTVVVPTNTPGGPTSTNTPLPPTATNTVFVPTSTPGSATSTATATNTPIPVATPPVEIYMLYAYGLTTATPQPDEAIRLMNMTAAPMLVGGWQIRNQAGGTITLPLTATIAAGQKIWIANTATEFSRFFGFSPDYEYGADSDPAVPQATASAGFTFADNGGAVQLYDVGNTLQDTLVYGTGNTSTPGWSGPALQYYLPAGQPGFVASGQIFYRKLDEITGQPVPDTNTKDDWAQDDDPTGTGTPTATWVPNDRENDDINGKKLLHPGWALTDPRYEDMFFTKKYTDTNVTTQFLVDPDNGYTPVHNLIINATQSITIETYEWHAAPLVQDIIDAKNRGVQVNIIIDGNPCCTQLPDDETLWSAQQWENNGIHVYFFSGTPATGNDTYRYNNTHAKIMVVDRQWVMTGADNFSLSALTTDPRGNGTAGERGALIITNAPDVVNYTLRMIDFDFQPGVFADVVEYPALGTPSPGFAPTPFPDMTGYTPVKPTPLVVTETESFEIVQAPDNALRDTDSLIGLINRAGPGDEVMVEQQYERKYWETSITAGPNPRLNAYIAAARRGANVRILLDGFFEGGDCTSATHNPATVAYINGLGLPNLQARVAAPAAGYPVGGGPSPTTGNIHNKMDLVSAGGTGYLHITSINGSANSSKLNREYGLQIQSNAGYSYYKDVFDYDWSVGYIPCGGGGGTPTPIPTPQCNLLINGDFETGSPSPWATTTPGVTAAVEQDTVFDGAFSIAVTHAFTQTGGGSQGIQQDLTNIVGGASYRVGAAVLRSDAHIASARLRITWYPCPTPGTCSGTNADTFLGNNGPTWQYISANVTAPANALSARVKPIFYTDGTAATIYFDDIVFDCNGNGTATPTVPVPTVTPTMTAPAATATATSTAVPSDTSTPVPSNTSTAVPPTATSTAVPPTATSTAVPPTATSTAVPPTATSTAVPPTATSTAVPPTATSTAVPSSTSTPVPPTATRTSTVTPSATRPAVSPTSTVTSTPPSATRTVQPTATSTPSRTVTPAPATGTPFPTITTVEPTVTFTRVPATATATAVPPSVTVAPPSATRTGVPATGTAQPSATRTPAATATPCDIHFSDVQPSDYFYEPVRYLYCHGVVSGYSDGTYRPYNMTTRAQMVKIVVLGFGLSIQTPAGGAYTFHDVDPANPFFQVIETAAAHQIVSGYNCGPGGPGPCDDQNRPYFLPNNNVTRGQLSKIDVIAAGWPQINPSTPTFTDVPPGSAFYTVIETAVCHGVVSGYADHTFRPFTDATRGQIAKIVYLSLTGAPACAVTPSAGSAP